MGGYPYLPDRTLEPPDTIGDDVMREAKIEAALAEWMDSGHLPGGHDDGTVNDTLIVECHERFHEMQDAYEAGDSKALERIAAQICAKRREIAVGIIEEEMER